MGLSPANQHRLLWQPAEMQRSKPIVLLTDFDESNLYLVNCAKYSSDVLKFMLVWQGGAG